MVSLIKKDVIGSVKSMSPGKNSIKKQEIEDYLAQLLMDNGCECLGLDRRKVTKEKRESPDFCLSDGKSTVGLEITEAIDENSAKTAAVRNKNYPDKPYCPYSFENKSEIMGSKEIKEKIEKDSFMAVRVSDATEMVFKNVIKAINKKRKKFNHYQKYDQNVLLIDFENRIGLRTHVVVDKLSGYISKADLPFDYIIIFFRRKKMYTYKTKDPNYYNSEEFLFNLEEVPTIENFEGVMYFFKDDKCFLCPITDRTSLDLLNRKRSGWKWFGL